MTAPVKTVSEGGARERRRVDAERHFSYFNPAKRRASWYEDVTVDTQPSVHRHMHRGWLVGFEDGRTTWSDDSTLLRSGDWFAFRDPGQRWERPFYREGSTYENQIESAVSEGKRDGLFADFAPDWVDFLRANLQVPAFMEHGLWLAMASVARDCLSDSVTHAVAMQAAMKQRMAQSIVLYAMDIEPQFGEMPIDAARERFLTHPAWQPCRRYVERLHSVNDWGEVIVAANLCFEPLVGVLIRRELGIRAASANGDTVTPSVARAGQLEWAWIAEWTAALVRFVLEEEEHGEANRATIDGWLADWGPQAEEAAGALEAIVEEMPVRIDLAEAQRRTRADADELLASCGLTAAPAR